MLLKKYIWFSTVIDSYGNLPKSFTWGNYFWFSSQELCDDLNDPFKITISGQNPQHGFLNQTSPFPVQFRMIYYGFESPAYVDLKLQFEVSWLSFLSFIHHISHTLAWLGSTALLTLSTIALAAWFAFVCGRVVVNRWKRVFANYFLLFA